MAHRLDYRGLFRRRPSHRWFFSGRQLLQVCLSDRSEERRVGKEGRSLCDWSSDVCSSDLPARWNWPRRLRSKWLAAGLVLLYLWSYEAFSLWNSPWLTAWIIVGYFVAALLIDGFFRGASFCKYVCPIGQFHFVQSLISPLEVKVRNQEICRSCKTFDCIRGNAEHRGCELRLFQPKKESNLDCTFCLDCVRACPHDNVGFIATTPARSLWIDRARSSIGRFARRADLAVLVGVLVFGAFANAAGMALPVENFLNFELLDWEFLAIDLGLLATLYSMWRVARDIGSSSRAFPIFLPWGIFALGLFGLAIWIIFQPMEMRGTFMS